MWISRIGLVQMLAHAALDVVHRQDVGVLLLRRPVERAELAARHADVRVVDVLVDDVVGLLAVQPLTHVVGERPHGEQIGMAVETEAVGARQTLAREHLVCSPPSPLAATYRLWKGVTHSLRCAGTGPNRPARGDGWPSSSGAVSSSPRRFPACSPGAIEHSVPHIVQTALS